MNELTSLQGLQLHHPSETNFIFHFVMRQYKKNQLLSSISILKVVKSAIKYLEIGSQIFFFFILNLDIFFSIVKLQAREVILFSKKNSKLFFILRCT